MSEPNSYAGLRDKLSLALTLFASVTLFVIMWLVVIDVVSRDAFNYSIVGLFEVVEILMGILVFAGVPIVTANQGHIAVNLLDRFIGPSLRIFQKITVNLVCTAILALFAWRLFDVAGKMAGYNDVTLFLKIPLAPVGYFMAIMAALSVPIQIALTFMPDKNPSEASADNI